MNYFVFEQITTVVLGDFNDEDREIITDENKLRNIRVSIDEFFNKWRLSEHNAFDFRYFNLSYNLEKMENIPNFSLNWPKQDIVFCLFFMWIYCDELGHVVENTLKDIVYEPKNRNKLKTFFLRFINKFKSYTFLGLPITDAVVYRMFFSKKSLLRLIRLFLSTYHAENLVILKKKNRYYLYKAFLNDVLKTGSYSKITILFNTSSVELENGRQVFVLKNHKILLPY